MVFSEIRLPTWWNGKSSGMTAILVWKWSNREIKRGSKLILRAGQDAIFINNGKIEGIFNLRGRYRALGHYPVFVNLERISLRVQQRHAR